MGLFNMFQNQLSQVIQWQNQPSGLLWYKYPSASNNEVKNASKLIIAPGQGAVLVYQGTIADVISTPGTYNLATNNHPFITTLTRLRQNFESEHKLDIYFYKATQAVNLNWGTPQPVKYIDSVYKIPVELGAFGSFAFAIADVQLLYTQYIGSKYTLTEDDMEEDLNSRLPQEIVAVLAESSIPYTQIDSRLSLLAEMLLQRLNPVYSGFGLQLTDFRILGTRFDDATRQRIARVSDVSADVLAAETAGLNYTELEKLRALRDAARNPGGIAAAGAQLGLGAQMGKAMLNNSAADPADALQRLKSLLDKQLITADEFDAQKARILNNL